MTSGLYEKIFLPQDEAKWVCTEVLFVFWKVIFFWKVDSWKVNYFPMFGNIMKNKLENTFSMFGYVMKNDLENNLIMFYFFSSLLK